MVRKKLAAFRLLGSSADCNNDIYMPALKRIVSRSVGLSVCLSVCLSVRVSRMSTISTLQEYNELGKFHFIVVLFNGE